MFSKSSDDLMTQDYQEQSRSDDCFSRMLFFQ
jgi:hypothetical protein